jgi:hypothetical protein
MEIIFEDSSKSLDEHDFEYLRDFLGRELPPDLKEMYSIGNGGRVKDERVVFYSELTTGEYGLDRFLPIRYGNGDGTLEKKYSFFTSKGFIPKECVPFAIDGGGFPFCYDLDSGKILFCNLEHFSPDFSHMDVISHSLNDVISSMITIGEAFGYEEEDDEGDEGDGDE